MDINRVIMIDADSMRESQGLPFLTIKYVWSTDGRPIRQPSDEPDLKQDIQVITQALMTIILQAEQQNICKQGEAISMVVHELQKMYVDANIKVEREKIGIEHINSSVGRKLDSGL